MKRKNELIREKEDNDKRKRNTSIKKNKSKKKDKKGEQVDKTNKIIEFIKKYINEKYDAIMKEAGIERKDYCICPVKPDGACGSTCSDIHCHRDRKLSRYVRRNINEYMIKFWQFFRPYFLFPYVVTVGCGRKEPFQNEEELNF